jgi:hypothetical protein
MSKIKLPWIVAILISLLFVRAWTRILYPEVWDEDGTRNLFGYINNGFLDIFEPVNGYLIVVPKLITFVSAQVSIIQYPLISTVLAWILIFSVLLIIATGPLRLVGGGLLAIACLWVPSDPEVYGLPLYTFWWTSLLLYALVFWDDHSHKWGLRTLIIVLASLSAPTILVVLPLFWARAWAYRDNRLELKLASLASIGAAIQLLIMLQESSRIGVIFSIDLALFNQIILKFLGGYAVGNFLPGFQWPVGIALTALLAFATWRKRYSWLMWAMFYLWFTAVLMSISRVDISIIHQALAGPRYFFFPFVLMTWWLLQIALTDSNRWLRSGAWSFLLLAGINVFPVLYREHDALHWQRNLYSCKFFDNYSLPIHYNGNRSLAWELPISGEQCSKLLARDPFYAADTSLNSPTYPYRVVPSGVSSAKSKVIDTTSVLTNQWLGMDYYSLRSDKTTLPGFQVIGSYGSSNSESGSLRVIMARGDQIWYRSEPRAKQQFIYIESEQSIFTSFLPNTSEWVLLEFSNINLPDKFIVQFLDGGDGWGEWSAVGLKLSQKDENER